MFFLIDVQPDRIDASRLSLSLWWADEGAAGAYRTQALSPEDAARAAAIRSPKATRDWRVSRALLQCVREAMPAPHTLSLSHSGGRALCARAPADWAVGVDLERMRPRATAALADWICDEPERAWLRQADGAVRLERFYLLWTLKEAFVKAAGLDFPADMAAAGLAPDASGQVELRPPPGHWNAAAWRLGADWMAAAVWRADSGGAAPIEWRAALSCAWPERCELGRWAGRGA
ncbi:4'-phosphopantetheinyl transferase family protein [Achromobacter xylosoxidans]